MEFHGLIPERVYAITCVTPKKDKYFKTPLGNFSYRYQTIEKYPLGINQVWIDSTHPVLMATIEKAICDYISLKRIPPLESILETQNFLENDLRIDREHWERFDPNLLQELSELHKSKNIDQILKTIDRERVKK